MTVEPLQETLRIIKDWRVSAELDVAVAAGGATIYLSPTHALVAQTKASLREMFPAVPVRDSLLSDDFYAEIDEDLSASSGQIA